MNKFLIKCKFHIYLRHRKYDKDEDESKFMSLLTLLMTLLAYPAFSYLLLKNIFHFNTFIDNELNNNSNNFKIVMTIYYTLPYTIVGFTYWLINRKKLNNLWSQYVNGEIELTKKDKIHSRIFYLGVLFIFLLAFVILIFSPPKIN